MRRQTCQSASARRRGRPPAMLSTCVHCRSARYTDPPAPRHDRIRRMSDAQTILGNEFAWRPTPEWIERSRVKAFMDAHGIPTYEALLRRSIDDPSWFWTAVLDELSIEFYEPYLQVMDLSKGPAWPQWC